ncbi:MAG: hypothetical protein OXH31_09715 [Gammaproteobacteria bacterium]|nr:hypothetical protein [Gammaproteobacteria bacterium]
MYTLKSGSYTKIEQMLAESGMLWKCEPTGYRLDTDIDEDEMRGKIECTLNLRLGDKYALVPMTFVEYDDGTVRPLILSNMNMTRIDPKPKRKRLR